MATPSERAAETAAEPYPLFVLVRLSDHCRLALVLLIFILTFLVFIIVIIGISRWGRDAGAARQCELCIGDRTAEKSFVKSDRLRRDC